MTPVQRAIEASGGPAKVAAALGVSVQAVCFYRDGKRRLPIEHGLALERLAGGAVSRRELFPQQWHAVWPELAATPTPATPADAGLDAAAPLLDGEGPVSPISMLPADKEARDTEHAQALLPVFERRRRGGHPGAAGGEARRAAARGGERG